ncbi:MAG: universal stress protein [Dehalococcoidia bacterium]|nr:universal stress protein [Dehalococcoidia bacterium]MCA9851854.1 universal stress protein [Dehalococcoidia bacterium]MCB9482554.1 universal stress protein [Dehalococcoidia bacterium]
MYSKILLPLDGSDLSREAINHAKGLAKATGAPLVLLQVIDSEEQLISQASGMTIEPMAMGEVTVDAARAAVAAQREAATQNLEAVKAELSAEGVKAETVIREGHPGEQIVEAVDELGADVVVMATHGRTGFRRAILGSVADHVARHTPTASVLLIRPQKQD